MTPEAPALRPGKVTFVVTNRGTMPHGFEIELEGESSGHGSGDLFKAEGPLLAPGETARMTAVLSMTGVYTIECLVDGHDDMGMEGPLEVSPAARWVPARVPAEPDSVTISNFSFDPQVLEIQRGTEVTWRNEDPADHTVTGSEGGFSSEVLREGDGFTYRFDEPGLYSYRCAIHPEMRGKVKVE